MVAVTIVSIKKKTSTCESQIKYLSNLTMSKIGNGAIRSKNARETYVEQLAQGRGENRRV